MSRSLGGFIWIAPGLIVGAGVAPAAFACLGFAAIATGVIYASYTLGHWHGGMDNEPK